MRVTGRARLEIGRRDVLAFRRRAGALDARLPAGASSLRRAAWAGLQDSMPRAALLSIHARVAGTAPSSWEDPSLVQVWGPRYSAYVVAADDAPIFTLGRYPDDATGRERAERVAERLDAFLAGRKMAYADVGRGLGVHPNSLRRASPTGRVLIRWDAAGGPTIWTAPRPAIQPGEARLELARRYLHVFGPTTPEAFAEWAGIPPAGGRATFDVLAPSLTPVRTPIGEGSILAADEDALREPEAPPATARLLPSGDAFWLLQGADRELLVPDARQRATLWTPRVWPGAILVAGEIAGTWRRSDADVSIEPWRPLSPEEREAVEAEASSLPLPGLRREVRVAWIG